MFYTKITYSEFITIGQDKKKINDPEFLNN